MKTPVENLMQVHENIWYLVMDENARKILEAIIGKISEISDGSERLKQLYDAARPFIPGEPKYDAKYW